jgi:hypothetical protein
LPFALIYSSGHVPELLTCLQQLIKPPLRLQLSSIQQENGIAVSNSAPPMGNEDDGDVMP